MYLSNLSKETEHIMDYYSVKSNVFIHIALSAAQMQRDLRTVLILLCIKVDHDAQKIWGKRVSYLE